MSEFDPAAMAYRNSRTVAEFHGILSELQDALARGGCDHILLSLIGSLLDGLLTRQDVWKYLRQYNRGELIAEYEVDE